MNFIPKILETMQLFSPLYRKDLKVIFINNKPLRNIIETSKKLNLSKKKKIMLKEARGHHGLFDILSMPKMYDRSN